MKRKLPVYRINNFKSLLSGEFYANNLAAHIKEHGFIEHPHKHDFYLVMLFTKGSGTHDIDFKSYPIKPGSIFFMRPGQMHVWHLSKDADGYIFFHDEIFFDRSLNSQSLQAYSLYSIFHNKAHYLPGKKELPKLTDLFKEVVFEFHHPELLKNQKIQALLNLIYIELLRVLPKQQLPEQENYLIKLRQFQELIDKHFKSHKTASEYADLMNLSDKHLNRICRSCLNKTSTELIAERIILEAKRLLISSGLSISQIAYDLGYKDKSYFTRIFKKQTGITPLVFHSKYSVSAIA